MEKYAILLLCWKIPNQGLPLDFGHFYTENVSLFIFIFCFTSQVNSYGQLT